MPGMSISAIVAFEWKRYAQATSTITARQPPTISRSRPKDRLHRIYPLVQSKSYRIQLDFSAPTDTPLALARNVP